MKRRPTRVIDPSLHDDRVALRQRLLLGFWALAAIGLLARAADLQIAQAPAWRQAANEQHRTEIQVPAQRGSIVDRDGVPLALSHETFRIGVAPQELIDPGATAALLARVLQIPSADAERMTSAGKRWVMAPGHFPPSVREALAGHRGVYVEQEMRRFYPQGGLGRGLLGAVIDQVGAGGIEQEFEAHLRGTPGAGVLARNPEGRPIPGETWEVRAPRIGGSVVLTLDAALQEITREALGEAIESTRARGGDLVATDPRTGEVLAMVSLRDGASAHSGAVNTSYEPGSTLKPFTLAALLRERKATLDDSVDTGNGSWTVAGRTIDDVSAVGTISVRHALQVSSNVGVAKIAQRLSREEQYEALRDFGFGVPTGIALPGETSGTLRRPDDWSAQSAASLAIGYEIAVTPIQMAMAYGALANGGVLMQPILVKELRDSRNRVVQRSEPRPIRRVVSRRVAAELTEALVRVVEEGTGTRARLASFAVAGKSGTSRAQSASGGYEAGAYFSSFVSFFPADDPQLVVFVKLERPQGAYYGGATAAPVTRAAMEAILAARESPLDEGALASLARSQRIRDAAARDAAPTVPSNFASRVETPPRWEGAATAVPASADGRFSLPALAGLSGRSAARRLHFLGLNVLWESAGSIMGTEPPAGSMVAAGDTVRLLVSSPRLGGPVAAPRAAVDD